MHLIHIIPGGLATAAVCRDTPPHLILHDEHTEFLHLLAQLLDVVADDAVVDVHVSAVVEQVQGAFHIDFQCGGNVVGFLFVLLKQGVVQVLKDGHILRAGVRKIFAVDQMHTAVDDGFLHRLQSLFAADHQFAQGQHKVGFQSQRIVFFRVVAVDVHRVDILRAGRADVDDLPMQTLHQRSVLCFRVADDNIIVRYQKSVGDFTLCTEGLAGTGSAENQTVRIFQLFAVHHNQVVGQGVQTVIQAFFAGLVQFLCGKRDKNCRAAGGQTSLDLDLTVCQRQAAHQPLLLLKVKAAQVAVVLLGNTGCLKNIVFQFLLRAPGVQHQKSDEEHPLVLALQFFQQGFCISAVGCQI